MLNHWRSKLESIKKIGLGIICLAATLSFTQMVSAKQIDLENATIELVNDDKLIYNGLEQKPEINVYVEGELVDSSLYTVSYSNNVDASAYYGISYEERVNKVLKNTDSTVNYQKLLEDNNIDDDMSEEGEIDYEDLVDDGAFINEQKPMPEINIQGVGEVSGSAKCYFTIYPKSITEKDIVFDSSNLTKQYAFEAKDKVPPVLIRDNGRVLNTFIDYVPEYQNNYNVGKATLKITGENNYCGEVVKTFNIVKRKMSDVTIKAYYDKKDNLIVKCNTGSYTMTANKEFKYSVKYLDDGSALVTVEGIGQNYTGKEVVTISKEDNPFAEKYITKAEIKKAKKKKTSLKKPKNVIVRNVIIKWKAKKDVTGYQLQYSTNKKFKKKKTKTIKNANSIVIRRLKLKKYYFRIRCFTEINGKKYYGDYSKTAKVKIKK